MDEPWKLLHFPEDVVKKAEAHVQAYAASRLNRVVPTAAVKPTLNPWSWLETFGIRVPP